jgi:hypothetical protein
MWGILILLPECRVRIRRIKSLMIPKEGAAAQNSK